MSFKERVSNMLMRMSFFINPQEEPRYPDMFGQIRVTNNAREKGLKSDELKEIIIMRAGKEIERVPYSKSAVQAYKEVYGIPIAEWEDDDEEEFEFDEPTLFGYSVNVK